MGGTRTDADFGVYYDVIIGNNQGKPAIMGIEYLKKIGEFG